MENPKVRWVEAHPIVQDGKELILIRDTEGITEHALIVPKEVAFMISLMDGTRALRDIQEEYMRVCGELVYLEHIQGLVDALDSHLLLFNEHYMDCLAQMREEYASAPVREPCLAGKSYSANRMELIVFLDEMFKGADGKSYEGKEITGILAPHIDYSRGMEVYRETYSHLRSVEKPLVIVLGTCHRPTDRIWSISVKDFSTPLDVIPHPEGLCGLIRENDVLKRYIDEWPHRSEHSIELQLPLIQFMAHNDFEMLPILTGSMQEYIEGQKGIDDGEITGIVESFKAVLQDYGKPYVIISGADLAHIGAQFGDQYTLDIGTLARSKGKDEAMLGSVRNVDPKGFFETIRTEGDSRRICGLTPIFFQLCLLQDSACDVVSYKQWTDGRSSVSFAGGVFYRKQ
jgi:AmmeMemoRadiSam system protein B